MIKQLQLLLILVLFAGCTTKSFITSMAQKIQKPENHSIAFFPIQNRSMSNRVLEEIQNEVYYSLLRGGSGYIIPRQKTKDLAKRVPQSTFFGEDLEPLKRIKGVDYLVFTKFERYELLPREERKGEQLLAMRMKIRIVNLTGGVPRVVSEEVITSNHLFEAEDLPGSKKKGVNAAVTPKKRAHIQLVDSLTKKIKQNCLYSNGF